MSSGLTPVGGGSGGGLAPVGGQTPPAPQAPPATAAPSPYPPPSGPLPTGTLPNPAASLGPGSQRAALMYDEPSGPNKILIGGIGVAVIALATLAYFVLRPPAPVPAPTGYTPWTAADNSVACDGPNDWRVTPHGKAAKEPETVSEDGVDFTRNGALIAVTLNTSASLVSNQLLFEGDPVPEGMSGSHAAGMQRQTKKAVRMHYKGYKEHRLETPPFENGMGGTYAREGGRSMADLEVPDYQVSEFTADSSQFGLGGKMHGYRASLAGSELIASVVCVCPERDWSTLQPAFQHVMESLHEVAPHHAGGGIAVPGSGVSVPGGIPGVGGN